MADSAFDIKKFMDDSIKTVVAPKEYFTTMPLTGGFIEPLIKAAIYGALAGVITFLWIIIGLGKITAMSGGAGLVAAGIGSLIITPIIGVAGLFIGGAIILAISAIAGGKTDYEASVRVASAIMVVMPIGAVFYFINSISFTLGALISMGINLYSLWILFNALITSLTAKESVIKIVLGILALLALIGGLYMLLAVSVFANLTS
ncbi:MAG: YIP1 family protein [Leptospirales bacterium]